MKLLKKEQFFSRNRWQNSIESVNGLSSSNGDQWWRVHKLKRERVECFRVQCTWRTLRSASSSRRMNHGPWNRSRETTHRKLWTLPRCWDIHRSQKGKFHNWYVLDIRNSNFIYELRISKWELERKNNFLSITNHFFLFVTF